MAFYFEQTRSCEAAEQKYVNSGANNAGGDLSDGVQYSLFTYTGIIQHNHSDQYSYPIYVTIAPHAIDFFFHGWLPLALDKESPAQGNGKGKDAQEKAADHYHVHCRLLHLPLYGALRAEDQLSAELCESYHIIWPSQKTLSTDNWYQKNRNTRLDVNPDNYYRRGYSCLKEFWPEKNSESIVSEHIHLRRLVLDFLFELEHGDAFLSSPHIREAEQRLTRCPVADALHAKAEYYWQRAHVQLQKDNRSDKDSINFRLYNWAEREWLKVCTTPETESFVSDYFGRDWFNVVENEVRPIAFFDGNIRPGSAEESWIEPIPTFPRHTSGSVQVSQTSTPSNPANAPHRWKDCVAFNSDRKTKITQSQPNSPSPATSETKSTDAATSEMERIYRSHLRMCTWFLRRYDLDAAFCCLLLGWTDTGASKQDNRCLRPLKKVYTTVKHQLIKTLSNKALFYAVLAIVLGLSLYVFPFTESSDQPLWQRVPSSVWYYSAILLTGIISVSLLPRVFKRNDTNHIQKLPFHPVKRILSAIIMLGGVGMLYAAAGCFGGSGQVPRSATVIFQCLLLLMPIVLVVLTALGAGAALWPKSHHASGLPLPRTKLPFLCIRMFLPRMLFALTGGWYFFLITEELWKSSLLASGPKALLVGFGLMTVVFVFSAVEIFNRVADVRRAIGRAFLVVGNAYILAVIIGSLLVPLLTENMVQNADYLTTQKDKAFYHDLKQHTYEDINIELEPEEDKPWKVFNELEKISWGPKSLKLFDLNTSYDRDKMGGIRYLYKTHFLGIDSINYYFIPGMILYRACFAVFIGLFLQLIFEEKAMTEPL